MPNTTLHELIHGKGAHVSPIVCIEDVSFGLASHTTNGYPHSISQVVAHMNYWMEYELRRIACDAPAYPDHSIQSWPERVTISEEQWKIVSTRFGRLLDQLSRLADSDSETLGQAVRPDPSKIARPVTVEMVLWQISAHNSYHIGQIALLRRQMDAWPPKAGGDSW
jgi:uncharacterized damage-inducible protein DinB